MPFKAVVDGSVSIYRADVDRDLLLSRQELIFSSSSSRHNLHDDMHYLFTVLSVYLFIVFFSKFCLFHFLLHKFVLH